MTAAEIREALLAAKARSRDDMVHPKYVVENARNPKDPLHNHFPWDDKVAAHEHRLEIARRLIRVYLVEGPVETKVVSLTIDRVRGGGYRDLEDVRSNVDLAEIMEQDAVRELRRAQAKYGRIKSLRAMWASFDKVAARVEARQKRREKGAA